MSYEKISDFRLGIDARKYFLSSPIGSLTNLVNGHISQGGEIEKRKTFLKLDIPAAYSGFHFGLQEGINNIYIFGSKTFPHGTLASRARTSNIASLIIATYGTTVFHTGDVVNISGVGGTGYNGNGIVLLSASGTLGQTITYASTGSNEGITLDSGGVIVLTVSTQLPFPLVYEALTNPGSDTPGGEPHMVKVISSTAFTGQPFVIAEYSDGTVFEFYGDPATVTLLRSGVTQFGAQTALLDTYVGIQLAAFVAVDSFSGQNLLKLLAVDINNNITTYTTNYVVINIHLRS